jgi:hypothetical protein
MSNSGETHTTLTTKRRDIRFFFNRTRALWTIQVISPDDPELVIETFHASSLEVLQPSYTLDQGKLQSFGILKRRKDKDEIQITNI